eukprot:TRINITY_DN1281_c0_g1_i1.p1 TRINITY_DN1281_c0_g1~~TRINITY_DN1281_c0_g1_i1.p1  ORF type:complete len:241 (+),score=40.97 TRINITY_DN1281_c0_g1_i1:110-832(+)
MRSSILYTCLLRTNIGGSSANSLLLAEHTEYVGNFDRYVLLYLSAAGINGYHGSFIVEENYRIVYVTQASYAVAVLCDVSFPASLAICHADEVLSTFMRDFFDKAQNAIRLELNGGMAPFMKMIWRTYVLMDETEREKRLERVSDEIRSLEAKILPPLDKKKKRKRILVFDSLFSESAGYSTQAVDFEKIHRSWWSRHQSTLITIIGVFTIVCAIYLFIVSPILETWPNILHESDYNVND